MRRAILSGFFFCSLIGVFACAAVAEFYGTFPTGLLLLEKKRQPYYLFVPPDYSPEKSWPLLVMLGKGKEDLKETIEPWVEWAKRNHFFLFVPFVSPREGSLPTSMDQWLFEIKQEIAQRYRIDPLEILLWGFEYGAHYAAYLGLNYPEEFSAAVLVGRAWAGPFEKLLKPVSNSGKQIPFYLTLDPQGEEFSRSEPWALKLEKKGYRVVFDPFKSDEDFSKLRDRITQWFRQDLEFRAARAPGKSTTKRKGTFREIRKNLFGM